jgi:hypothetical protein
MKTLHAVILLALLCMPATTRGTENLPLAPPQEAPPSPLAAPVRPWLEHAGGSAPAPSAAASPSIELRDIAVATPEEIQRMTSRPRSHLQGPTPQTLDPPSMAVPFDSRPPPFAPILPTPPWESATPDAQGGLLRNFGGIGHTGWFPPDTVVAVGPEHVLAATNSGYAIYSKTGRQIRAYTTMDSLFTALRPANWVANEGFMFDPKVFYDATHEKFVMFTLGRADVTETSHFFLAISQTSDATRGWWLWRFDWPETNTWIDYSSIASDTWGLYVTGDIFYFGGGFRYVQLWAINPAVFSGGANNGWRFWDLRWPLAGDPLIFDLQVARPQSVAGGAETFFVNSSAGSYNQIALWKLTGDRTNAPALVRTSIPTSTYYPIYLNVRQPGTTARIDGFSTQMLEAAYSQRHVWASLGSGENSATPTWGGMYTARLNVDSNTMNWESLIWSPDQYYTFPAVTVGQGLVNTTGPNVGLFGTWTAPDRYASTIYHVYDPDAAASFVVYRNGEAAYELRDDSGRNRWGDYSGAAYDWTCGTLWGAAEFAGTLNRWGTQIAEVDFTGTGACPRIDVTMPLDATTWYAGNSATVQWNNTALAAGNQIYIRYVKSGSVISQLAGPLAISTTARTVTMPWDATTLGQIEVGAWNPTTSTWQILDRSDAYFTLAAAPDLNISSFSVSNGVVPITSIVTGAAMQLTENVNNGGNGTSAASTLRFYRSADNIINSSDTLVGTSAIPALIAGGNTGRGYLTQDTGPVGTWYFGACLDVVANDPPGNNCTASPVAISVRTQNMFANGFE